MKAARFSRQWGWPVALAVLTMFGLLSALIGEGGIWWALSWIALTVPILVIAWHWVRSGKKRMRDARHPS